MIECVMLPHIKRDLLVFLMMSLVLASLSAQSKQAGEEQNGRPATVHFFFNRSCGACQEQMPLMRAVDRDNPNVEIVFHDVRAEPELLVEFAQRYKTTTAGTPITFIGDMVFKGYSEEEGPLEYYEIFHAYLGYRNQIVQAIEMETQSAVAASAAAESQLPRWAPFLLIPAFALTYFLFKDRRKWIGGLAVAAAVSAFLFVLATPAAQINTSLRQLPFPAYTTLVALADGFNPCAFTVLVMLLSLLTYTRSRGQLITVGLVFIAASALVYFVLIIALVLVGSVAMAQLGTWFVYAVAAVLLVGGILNVTDFFSTGASSTLGVSAQQRAALGRRASQLIHRLRHVGNTPGTRLAALGGVAVLAISANLVEAGCTALLPTAFMTALIVTYGDTVGLMHVLWTAAYSAIYVLPLLVILVGFAVAFTSRRLTPRQGKALKLATGAAMLLFGGIMLLNPALLHLG